jgi:ATP-dependent exoDNAse (exonuclease V) alpha subunit
MVAPPPQTVSAILPAYAATIHKAHGSEYPAVAIPLLTQHSPMLQRNLLYAGITRGKWLVVLVGGRQAVAIAVRNTSGRRRWSKLRERLAVAPVPESEPRGFGSAGQLNRARRRRRQWNVRTPR